MRSSLAAALVVLAVLAPGVLAAGCGSKKSSSNGEDAKTPTQIVADVTAATKTASAVHVVGAGTSGGQPLTLDLHLVAGKGGYGHVSIGGLGFDIVRIGDKAWFKGGPAFWKHFGGTAAAQLFKDKWIEAPANTGDLASFAPLTDLVKLTGAILGNHGTLTKGAAATINGQSAIGLVDASKGGGILYISTTGSPYPLELKAGKGDKGTIDFTDWNNPGDLAAPKGAIDYSQLTGSG